MPKRLTSDTQLAHRKARSRRSRSRRTRLGRDPVSQVATDNRPAVQGDVEQPVAEQTSTAHWTVPSAIDVQTVRTPKPRSALYGVPGRNRFRLGFWIPMLLIGCLTVGAAVGLSMEMSQKGNLQWTRLFHWNAR